MVDLTDEDDALLEALGVELETKKESPRTPREERVVTGFEEIQRFVEQHQHTPEHGEERDIFERLYAVRLDRLRALDDYRTLLAHLDHQGLLSREEPTTVSDVDEMDDDELLAQLGGDGSSLGDITDLRHVRSAAEKRAAEEIASRTVCEDFEQFGPLFETVRSELKSGVRQSRAFKTRALDEIQQDTFFIIAGQIAYVAEVGKEFQTQYQRRDSRLRVIYDNATESDVLRRSLQRALHRDEAARLITDPNPGPLFSEVLDDDDVESGTIYVLRSLSEHPYVVEHRELIHKIGVTGGKLETRIANASKETTYLLADVEVVASYKLSGINRTKLENLIHRVFAPAQIELTIQDRFGQPVSPREWFLVPLHVIDEVVQRIRDGSIIEMVYEPNSAGLIEIVGDLSTGTGE
jgi:hypothetical protein